MEAIGLGKTVRWARKRAGMTQRDLASACGMPQPTIARIERGTVMPRSATLVELLRATGHELAAEPMAGQGVDPEPIRAALARPVPARVARALGSRSRRPDTMRILKRLRYFAVRFVLIGQIAEAAHGVPGRIPRLVEICPARDDVSLERLATAFRDLGVTDATSPAGRTTVTTTLGRLALDPEPLSGEGYETLSRTAVRMPVDAGIVVAVAPIEDLLRIRRARSGREDRTALDALGAVRRELEEREEDRRAPWPGFQSRAIT